MIYIKDVKELKLNPNEKYIVKDNIRCRKYECRIDVQTDFLFLFIINDPKVLDNKICISKIDYFLDINLIKPIEKISNKNYNGWR